MDVLLIERYGEYIRVTQRDRLARGSCQVKNQWRTRRATSLKRTAQRFTVKFLTTTFHMFIIQINRNYRKLLCAGAAKLFRESGRARAASICCGSCTLAHLSRGIARYQCPLPIGHRLTHTGRSRHPSPRQGLTFRQPICVLLSVALEG